MNPVLVPTTTSTVTREVVAQPRRSVAVMDTPRFVTLNNQGVALLETGENHLVALQCFREAMDIIRGDLERITDDDDGINGRSNEARLSNVVKSVPILTSFPAAEGRLNVTETDFLASVSPHNSFCFYSRAFYLDPACPEPVLQSQTVDLAIVFLFNMAIACQQYGFLKGSTYLKKAAGLYSMITSLAEHQAYRTQDASYGFFHPKNLHRNVNDAVGFDPIRTLLLGVTCNLGHIYSHFCMDVEASNCHFRLIQLMSQNKAQRPLSSDARNHSTFQRHPTLSDDEVKVFVLNTFLVSHSVPRHFAPAA